MERILDMVTETPIKGNFQLPVILALVATLLLQVSVKDLVAFLKKAEFYLVSVDRNSTQP